ncbi:hypothetical protein CEXT_757191 [Caerostris extrusa]|uniref:Uncharacterized protein n=1 Tax=Caerostris extrusa TaxID=172846 RepID=A0AAV4V8J0_CAEEX|nr:hypothetical protein CEXT_757191 [Caerostris extrusa]
MSKVFQDPDTVPPPEILPVDRAKGKNPSSDPQWVYGDNFVLFLATFLRLPSVTAVMVYCIIPCTASHIKSQRDPRRR